MKEIRKHLTLAALILIGALMPVVYSCHLASAKVGEATVAGVGKACDKALEELDKQLDSTVHYRANNSVNDSINHQRFEASFILGPELLKGLMDECGAYQSGKDGQAGFLDAFLLYDRLNTAIWAKAGQIHAKAVSHGMQGDQMVMDGSKPTPFERLDYWATTGDKSALQHAMLQIEGDQITMAVQGCDRLSEAVARASSLLETSVAVEFAGFACGCEGFDKASKVWKGKALAAVVQRAKWLTNTHETNLIGEVYQDALVYQKAHFEGDLPPPTEAKGTSPFIQEANAH